MAKFTVDTHLFRELGELLVGRDSTALVELVKNAYDADATEVVVSGENLGDADEGKIVVQDNGTGMTVQQFHDGFLRIASRMKESSERRSNLFGRRFTGAKGIGRLAAHKLARRLEVTSRPWTADKLPPEDGVAATIDWNEIEKLTTLDEIEASDAITVEPLGATSKKASHGTIVTLVRLRRAWTAQERARFFAEVHSFDAPDFLKGALPKKVVTEPLVFEHPVIREPLKAVEGAKFSVRLDGDFAGGDEYWQMLSDTAGWLIEIRATKDGKVTYGVAPTRRTEKENPSAERFKTTAPHPGPTLGPFFDARILIREGKIQASRDQRTWASRASGIRVYLEGFRVLPYGDSKDDWLSLDADYTRRTRRLEALQDWSGSKALPSTDDRNAALIHLPNNNYVGAVFLTQDGAPSLRPLVNREGFVPEAGFDAMARIVRTGIDLATRVRASAGQTRRHQRKEQRTGSDEQEPRSSTRASLAAVSASLREARALLASGRYDEAAAAVRVIEARLGDVAEELGQEVSLLRVVASVGTQMAAFVHEVNSLLGSSQTVEAALTSIAEDAALDRDAKKKLRSVLAAVSDLRRGLERQGSYLVDVVTPDARRRRTRMSLSERFDAAVRLIQHKAERQRVEIRNEIAPDLKSPPMFASELTSVFSNLLTNAIKAVGANGEIRATARMDDDGVVLKLENTGAAVKLTEAERWFRPFESTTSEVDATLGQGMGLGLPITRSILADYGAEIRFVKPSQRFATAVEITFST